MTSSGSGVSFEERFLIINSTTLIDTGYSNFIFLVQILATYDFQGICEFQLSCQMSLHKVINNVPLLFF